MHDFSRYPSTPVAVSPRLAVVPIPFPSARNLSTWSTINLLGRRERERERERKEGRKFQVCWKVVSFPPPFFFYTRNKIVAKGLARRAIIHATNLTGAITFERVSRRRKSGKEKIVSRWRDWGEDLSSHCNARILPDNLFGKHGGRTSLCARWFEILRLHMHILNLERWPCGEESFLRLYIAWISNDRWIIVGRRLVSRCLFADVGVVCRFARSLVQCRFAFFFASCEMLRDITNAIRCRIIVVAFPFVFSSFFFSFISFVRVSILRSPWMITLSEQTLVLLFTFVIYFFLYYCAPRSFEDRSVSLLF